MNYDKNNLSTIFVLIYMLISPILIKYGYEIKQEIFVSAMVAIVGLISAIYSAQNPNHMNSLGNSPKPIDPTEPVLNDEYESDEA